MKISKEKEIELLETLMCSDSYFADTFKGGEQAWNRMANAIRNDHPILFGSNLADFGLAEFQQLKELGLALDDRDHEYLKLNTENEKLKGKIEALKNLNEQLQLQLSMMQTSWKLAQLKLRMIKDEDYVVTKEDKELLLSID